MTMNKLIFSLLILCSQISFAQTVLWSEDFSDGAETTSGTAAGTPGGTWSVTTAPSGTFTRQAPLGVDGFYVNNTVTEGVWASNNFSIATTGMVTVSIQLSTLLTSASDYLRAYYRVDGGPEILFAELLGSIVSVTTSGSAIVSGSNVQIVVRSIERTAGGLSLFRFDAVVGTSVPAVYSRASTAWNVGTTWSTTGFAGASCACTPTTTQVAIIGGGFTVDFTADATVGGVDIQNTGTLRYTAANLDLGIELGLLRVRSGGILNSNAQAGAQIDYNQDVGGASLQVDAGGTVTIEDVTLSTNASNLHYFLGGGSLSVTDDVLFAVDNATLTNDMTTALSVGDRIEFSAGTTGSSFVNNGTVTATSAYYDDDTDTFNNTSTGTATLTSIIVNDAADDNSVFTNSGTLTLNGAVSINTTSGNFFINNSGTINQVGDFSNLVAGSDFTNQTNGVWNWSFVSGVLPANIASVLICSASNNTFNYTAAGNQQIVGITYHHLGNSGSGTKTLAGTTTANGNLTISGTATTAPSTFSLTVTGTTTITGGGFNDASDTGTDIFVGNVSIGGSTTFNTTSVTTTANLVFRGGIANAGTFSAGGATFNTNAQALTGANALSFGNNVAITTIVVTNSNTGAFTVTGTTTLTNGGFTDSDDTSITTFVGAVSQSGTSAFNTTGVFSSGNLIFRGGISNTGGTFTAGGATFNTNGQAIAGNTAISFANFVVVTGVTVTNNNTASVSLTRIPGGITLTGTGTWTQGAASTLNYTGTSIDITTFNASAATNTVNYNSTTSAQTIRVPASTYTNLTLNNTSGISPQFTPAGSFTVTGILTMTTGNTDLNGTTLTLSSTASGGLVHGLTSASGWIYGGSLARNRPASTAIGIGTAYSLFPLGSSGDWRPFFAAQSSNANSAGLMTVAHTNATTTTAVAFAESIVRRHDAYWTVSTSGIAAGANYDLRAGGTNFGTIEAGAPGLADLRMSTSTGVVGGNAAASGGPDYRVNRVTITFPNLANNYHVASTDATNSPLPIELVSFKGEVVEDAVRLIWETASELNNDFFAVERSTTGEAFTGIGNVTGSGTTNQGHTYNLMDFSPISGTAYYRLKQTDFDGTFTYSNIISVTYEGPASSFINVYPNPSNGEEVTIEIKGLKNSETIPVFIYDQLGRQRTSLTLDVDKKSGTAQRRFTFKGELPEGVYIVKAGSSQLLVKRFIVTQK